MKALLMTSGRSCHKRPCRVWAPASSEGPAPKWSDLHDKLFSSAVAGSRTLETHGHELPVNEFPGLLEACDRELDMLLRIGYKFPEDKHQDTDTSQNAGMSKLAHEDELGCLTPRCHVYLGKRARYLLGVEAMYGQGLAFEQYQSYVDGLPSSTLLELAGNAFHGGHCAAVTLACLAALATLHNKFRVESASKAAVLADNLDSLWQ